MKKSVLWIVIVLLALSLLFVACKSKKEPDNPTENDETTESTEVTTQSPCAVSGHLFDVWYVTTQPTCTETGMERHDCENCDYYEQQRVAATGHIEVIDEAVPNTCTTTGLTEGKHCSVCNEVFIAQEVIAALGGHEWTEATCTTPKTCTTCGTTEGEVGGHDMMDSVCSICNHSDCFEFTLLDDGTYSVKAKSSPKFPAELVFPTTYLGKTVSTIESYGFPNCEGVTSITVPDSVKSIGYHAFSHCDDLTSITLPFLGNPVDGSNCEHLGYLFGTRYPDITEQSTPKSLKTVIITGGDSIGQYAFLKCSNLTSITLPESVTSIGYYAFGGCKSLTDISLGSNVTFIGDYAFMGCVSLTSTPIPDSVTSIGSYAYAECDGVTSITIPNNVTRIGSFAFAACDKLTSVTIPDSVISIGKEAFAYCEGLTSITIPSSITNINAGAFNNCTGLTSVYITDLTAWCNLVFADATANPLYYAQNLYLNGKLLTELVVPDEATQIGDYAFYNCSALTNVTIPANVTYIGQNAFYGCSALASATFELVNGWRIHDDSTNAGLNSTALSDPSDAVKALKQYYYKYYWSHT